MTKPYTKNYRTLGIQPGVSWKQLRQAYKSLVNTWHPDRFQQDARRRKLAEEKTKEITQSYYELAEYYKKFGILPLTAKTADTPIAGDMAPDARTEPESQPTKPAAAVVTPVPVQKSWQPTLVTRAIAAIALLGIAYLFWQLAPSEHNDNPPAIEKPTNQAVDIQDSKSSDRRTAPEKQFTIGSSLGEVYAIEGVPTKTENDVWYYGNSKVYFVKGKVLRWEESADNPLQIRIAPGAAKSEARFFGKGSSKEEVLAVQGTPDRDAGTVWDYGLSRVYFEKDLVTGWNETPLNPLRVQR